MTYTVPLVSNYNLDQSLFNTVNNQVFTPSGRYAISAICSRSFGTISIPDGLLVIDLFEKKIYFYRLNNRRYINWDIFYCINDVQMVILDAFQKGFGQAILNLNHNERTITVTNRRVFSHDFPHMMRHPYSHSGTTISYEGEDHIIWFSLFTLADPNFHGADEAPDVLRFHRRLFLIPKDPNSQSKAKLFYVKMNKITRNNNEVIQYYQDKYDEECISPMVPMIVKGRLCLPIIIKGKIIMGIYLCIDICKLSVIENERINLKRLDKKQECAYSIISSADEVGEVEFNWPLYKTKFYANEHCVYLWKSENNIQSEPNAFHRGSAFVLNGQLQIQDYKISKELNFASGFSYTIHPCGFRLRWSNLTFNSIDLSFENIGGPVGSLFNLAKKKLFLEDLLKNIKDPAVLKILWGKI